MHRRGRSSGAPKSSSVGSSMAAGPSSDESSGVETDSSARSPSNDRDRIKFAQNHRRQKRKRPSRPAAEDIVDGFAICSFETIQDLTFFLEKKILIQPCSESSSSESDFEPARPSSAKSSDTVSLSSSPKHDWKHRQTSKFISCQTEFDGSTDRSLSPEPFGLQDKATKTKKSRRDHLRSDNQSMASGVSLSSSLSVKNRRPNEEEDSDEKDSLNSAPFAFVSKSSLPKEESQCNSSATDVNILLFDGLCNAASKRDGHLSVTDGESESSVILVKEELKEPRWTTTDWTKRYRLIDNKKESDATQKEDCETAEAKKGMDSIQTSLVSPGDRTAKWTVIKETQNLTKLENASPTFIHRAGQGQTMSPLASSESHSSSLDKLRTFQHKDPRHDLDPDGLSFRAKVNVDSLSNSKSNFLRNRLDSDNSASNPRNANASNESRSSSTKARSRDGSSGASKGSSGAVPLTLTAAEIKHECTSPASVRISSRQSSSRSSATQRKSSHHHHHHHHPQQSLGNGDFSSLHMGERSLRSPLATHHVHLHGPPIQPAAFSLGSLSIPPGLFPSSLPHLPVPGLHPSSAFLGSSGMGLHPSLLASAPLMPNPVSTNPDLFQVQQELNARFLQDHRLLPLSLPHVPLTLRTEMHQHQHLHHHQHVMPAPYLPSMPGTFSMASHHPLSVLQTMGPSGLDLINHSQTLSDFAERERISKIRASLNLSDGFLPPSYASLIPGVLPNGLTSNMHGAFTINESKLPSMSASHLLRSLRNDQQVAPPSIPSAPTAKKRGRWCAAHVEIAFRICYHKQQQQQQQRQMHLDAGASQQRRHLTSSNIHHFPRMMGGDMPPISSLQQPPLHFGVSSFLRPTPQSMPPIDVSGFLSSSSASSMLSSSTFISRPSLLYSQPGGMSLKSEVNSLAELRRGGSSSSASSSFIRSGVDSVSLHFAEQDRKRRLHERERESEEQHDKNMRMEASAASELRLRSAKRERNSSPHLPYNDNKTGLIHRHGPASSDVTRIHHPPESRSPFLSSADRSSRSTIDSSKKRGHLAMPLSIDTHVVDYPSGATPGQVLNPPTSVEARHRQDSAVGLIPSVPLPTDRDRSNQMERDRSNQMERDQMHRNRLAQSYYAQSALIHDGDRYRGLLPASHSGLGLSFNGLSKLEQDSFKPYANLNSSSSQLEVAKSVGDVFKSPDVMFKPNPDGLLIVTSNAGGARLSFPGDGCGGSIPGLPPPPLVRLDHGLLSFKRPGPYGSLSDFSSNLCGLPGGVVDGSGLGLPFR